MWILILNFLVNNISFKDNSAQYLNYHVGVRFNELAPELVEELHHAKNWTVDNSKYFSKREAENGDNCFIFTDKCQPDYEHHIYELPIPEHPGYVYRIVFSYNYILLKVENSYLHI